MFKLQLVSFNFQNEETHFKQRTKTVGLVPLELGLLGSFLLKLFPEGRQNHPERIEHCSRTPSSGKSIDQVLVRLLTGKAAASGFDLGYWATHSPEMSKQCSSR